MVVLSVEDLDGRYPQALDGKCLLAIIFKKNIMDCLCRFYIKIFSNATILCLLSFPSVRAYVPKLLSLNKGEK